MEMELQDSVIGLQHAFQTGLQDVALLNIDRPRTAGDLQIEGEG
jgi:hypothetical protein